MAIVEHQFSVNPPLIRLPVCRCTDGQTLKPNALTRTAEQPETATITW